MYEALMFLLIWYSTSTTLFQMIQSKVFISDCGRYFDAIGTFIQNVAGWVAIDEPLEYAKLYLDGNLQMWVDAEDSLEL